MNRMNVPGRHPRRCTRRQMLKALLLACGGAAAAQLPVSASPVAARCGTPVPPAQFSGEIAMQHAAAQMQWVPRHPGTEGARLCGDYILAQLAELGWATEEQPFTYRDTPCRNLIGKRGSGPVLIIGAHYDTRRRADRDPDPAKRDLPVPGANDGASGVAVLLELARILKPETLGRTIWLTAFDAEDNGGGGIEGWDWIVGSRYMAQNLEIMPQGMVLVDMIGDADLQIYYERNSTAELREGIWQVAAELGYSAFIPQVKYSILDDHIPFLQQGIPAVDLIDFDYPSWHTVADTLDKISAASLESVGRTLHNWLLRGAPGLSPLSASTTICLPLISTYAFDNVPEHEVWLA
jgi:hypothetical protein